MTLILCVDDRGGLSFNGRRQSQDRRVREDLLAMAAGGTLWMDGYSRRQFTEPEAAAIRERLPRGGAVIALCIEGKPCSSVELSRRMQELAVSGKSQLTFLIGGSVGLSEDLKRQADWRLSMSPMTFPHHLARIMLLEQIYRACQIAAGTKYHK